MTAHAVMSLRAVLALVLLAACPRPPRSPEPEPGPVQCHLTTPELLLAGTTDPEQLACVAADMTRNRERFAHLVAGSMFTESTRQQMWPTLERIPVEDASWYELANLIAPYNPFAAAAMLDLAARSTDPDFRVAIDVAKLRIARQRADNERAATIVKRVVSQTGGNDARTLNILDQLANADEYDTISAICRENQSPGITWPCFIYDREHQMEYLKRIANLPILDYLDSRDFQKPRIQSRLWTMLPGLHCLFESTRNLDLDTLLKMYYKSLSNRESLAPEEVIIYHRLHDGAPAWVSQCLLAEASIVCLHEIRSGKACPLLFTFADLVRTLSLNEQYKLSLALSNPRSPWYDILESDSNEGQIVLFHVHLTLAEALIEGPEYHLAAALQLWSQFSTHRPESSATFADLLSSDLKQRVCDSKVGSVCRAACRKLTDQIKPAVCATH